MPQNETAIQKVEEARDLRSQLGNLEADDQQQIIFKEISPRRKMTTIYSMRDGEPLDVPEYQARQAIGKWDSDLNGGSYMFTATKEKAPEYKLGSVLCFLHRDSPDQAILQEIGLSNKHCRKDKIPDLYNKRIHARNRHPREWEAYQSHIEETEKSQDKQRQQSQLDATMALAGRAAASAPSGPVSACPEGCGYEGTKRQMQGHKMGAHKAEAATPL